jgi:hypothetical protein
MIKEKFKMEWENPKKYIGILRTMNTMIIRTEEIEDGKRLQIRLEGKSKRFISLREI